MNVLSALSFLAPVLLITSPSCLALTSHQSNGNAGRIIESGRHSSSSPPAPRSATILRDHSPESNNLDLVKTTVSSSSSKTTTQLSMLPEPDRQQPQQQRYTEYMTPDLEVPTTTQAYTRPPGQMPPRPKVVVFGASGRIGRRILKRLLNSGVDMDVVAIVRSAERLDEVLYDEEDLVLDNYSSRGTGGGKNNGAKLQVVVCDVVSRRDVYKQSFETDDEKRALDDRVGRAKSYFTSKGWNYDDDDEANNSNSTLKGDMDVLESGGEEALKEAIAGSTVIISCLSASRRSELWNDYLKVPILRVFRRNASKWCSDPTHPYYVNYLSTKKILKEAENEQEKRNVALKFEKERVAMEDELERGRKARAGKEEEGFESGIAARLASLRKKRSSPQQMISGNSGGKVTRLPKSGQLTSASDRIKFIRISNLMVGRSPFRIPNVLTNALYSQLSKFELMGETLMESSTLVDTIVLRPGVLTDDERNVNHTSLQLCIDGKVDAPSLVGREDVADLAVVSALTKTTFANETTSTATLSKTADGADDTQSNDQSAADTATKSTAPSAHHYTWAVRWTGQHLSPPQGLRPDGLSSAALCFVKAVREQTQLDKRRNMDEHKLKSYFGGKEMLRFKKWRRRRILFLNKAFAQSLAISIPVYATLGLLGWYLFGQAFIDLFARVKGWNNVPQAILNLIP